MPIPAATALPRAPAIGVIFRKLPPGRAEVPILRGSVSAVGRRASWNQLTFGPISMGTQLAAGKMSYSGEPMTNYLKFMRRVALSLVWAFALFSGGIISGR